MKNCSKCLLTLEFNHFYSNKKYSDGFSCWCKSCHRNNRIKRYYNNRDENIKKTTLWQQQNKEKVNLKNSKWAKNNRDKTSSNLAKYKAKKIHATPKWLSIADLIEIREFYKLANLITKITGIKYEVDHIIPLQGQNISGLHVPSNLQVITKSENARKKNHL